MKFRLPLFSVLYIGLLLPLSVAAEAPGTKQTAYYPLSTPSFESGVTVRYLTDEGQEYPSVNGTMAVPFHIPGFIGVDIDPVLYPDYNIVRGALFAIPNPDTPERVPLGSIWEVTWEEEGVYEIDVYGALMVPVGFPEEPFPSEQTLLAPYVPSGTYLGTVRITIQEAAQETCCSSVLFLPGIKGSRLYDGDGNKLWEPLGNQDIETLMLDGDGNSIRNDITTESGEIIDSIAGLMDVYGSFMDFMDTMVEENTINDWKPVAYDWRLSLPDIISSGTEEDGRISYIGTADAPYIRKTLDELAATSKT